MWRWFLRWLFSRELTQEIKVHTFETITKVVSGQTSEVLDIVAEVYGSVVTAGVHKASSIKVAEAAKVIENTQRDVNIALMNELALILIN